MALTELPIPSTYFTATSEKLLKEFYIPALGKSILYQRGVAFFSISFFLYLLDEILSFVEKGGEIQLITSVKLDAETIESFANGYAMSSDDIEERFLQSLNEYKNLTSNSPELDAIKLDVMANLIASKRLSLKVAYVPSGIYHEKIGVFSDSQGNCISFLGSANETFSAYHKNFETINVFKSWNAPEIVEAHRQHFVSLWNGQVDGLVVMSFPEAVKSQILHDYQTSSTLKAALEKLRAFMQNKGQDVEQKTNKVTIRSYQQLAIDQFAQNNFRHFYEMATGTGKTFTAVKSIERMVQGRDCLNVVILVPLQDLQRQWCAAIRESLNATHSVFCFGGGHNDKSTDFNIYTIPSLIGSTVPVAIAVCVYDTFFNRVIGELFPSLGETLLIVDEAHNLTPNQLKQLEDYTSYRLGLSATPQRYKINESQAILNYFCAPNVPSFKFGLKEAIQEGYLSPYKYYPILVSLTDDEEEKYNNLTKQISIAQAKYDDDPSKENQKKLEDLKMSRSRIVKKATNKLFLLKKMVNSTNYDFSNSVVFCGQGEITDDVVDGPQKIIDWVTKILSEGTVKRYFPAKYTSGEDDRPARLENFKKGLTDTLVAIKCFDEGIDVPALDKIYVMASDTSYRQTVQRRGRVLRISKETGKEFAKIYDMVAAKYEPAFGTLVPLQSECLRVKEYASLSLNPTDSDFILSHCIESSDETSMEDTLIEGDC